MTEQDWLDLEADERVAFSSTASWLNAEESTGGDSR